MAVVSDALRTGALLLATNAVQSLGRAVTSVGAALSDEPLCLRMVERQSFGLRVRSGVATNVRPLVPVQADPAQGFEHRFDRALGAAALVGILDSDHERAVMPAGEQPREDGRSHVADVRVAGGTWGETDSDVGGHGRWGFLARDGLARIGRASEDAPNHSSANAGVAKSVGGPCATSSYWIPLIIIVRTVIK